VGSSVCGSRLRSGRRRSSSLPGARIAARS
jgi:hypothetical protein